MSLPALSVRDLSVTLRRGSTETVVVDAVSFDVQPGEVLALVGESGCGKTKTAEAIMGLVPPVLGTVRAQRLQLAGVELTRMGESALRRIRGRDVSMVFQELLTSLDPVLRAGEQLASVFRRHRGLRRSAARHAASEMLSRVGFADTDSVLRRFPHELSGGQRQRVLIAMAMACRPAVLIADEPTTALDVTTQAQVLAQITELAQAAGTAILLITHDLGVVAHYSDRALVMRRGRIVESATTRQLFANPVDPYTVDLLAATRAEIV